MVFCYRVGYETWELNLEEQEEKRSVGNTPGFFDSFSGSA